MNLFAFTGNIGGDVKVNNAGGTAVANFSVAVKAGYGDKAQTIWIACALWGKQAESKLVDYLVKGQGVAVSGELSTREHDGKTYLQVRVGTIDLVGGGKSEGGQSSAPQQSRPQQSQQGAPKQPDAFDDDIPFAPAHHLMGA
jgi:single-strand DNA-binding protein